MVYKFDRFNSKNTTFHKKEKNVINSASYQGRTKAAPSSLLPCIIFFPGFCIFYEKKADRFYPKATKSGLLIPALKQTKRGHGISILQSWVSFLFPNLSREKKKRIQVNYLFSTYMVNNDGDRPVPGISSRFS